MHDALHLRQPDVMNGVVALWTDAKVMINFMESTCAMRQVSREVKGRHAIRKAWEEVGAALKRFNDGERKSNNIFGELLYFV